MQGRVPGLRLAGRCSLVLGTTLLCAGRADAQWTGFVHVNGGVQVADHSVTNVLQVGLYDETATYEAAMTSRDGTIVDAWAGVHIWRNLGFGLGATVLNARGMIALEGSVPSPLFRNRHRTASLEHAGLKHQQVGMHVQAVYLLPVSQQVNIAVSAGPSWFRLRHDALASVDFGEEYAPYNSVSLTALTTTVEEEIGIGYNVGADVTILFTRWLGVGLYLRYISGSVELEMPGGSQSIGTGGMQAGTGLRFLF